MAEDAADDAEDKYDDLLDEIDLVSVCFLWSRASVTGWVRWTLNSLNAMRTAVCRS